MRYRWIKTIEAFKDIACEWDAALEESEKRNPFLLSDFILAWWEHCKGGASLRILEVRDGDRLAGGIPLCLKKGAGIYGFARVLSFMGGSAASYTEPFYARPDLAILPTLKKALAKNDDWDALYLPDVRGECPVIRECGKDARDADYVEHLIQDHSNWAIDLTAGPGPVFEKMTGKLRRDLRAKRKHLAEKYGYVALQEIKGEADMNKYFELYSRFSLNAFSGRGRKSSFEDRQYAAFLKDFLTAMDKKGRLAAHVLLAGDRVAAISFGYRFGKGFDWALTGFDYELKYFRPGYLLIEELIRYVCGQGLTYYNWFGHDRFYKNQWCDHQTPLYKLWFIRRSIRGNCYRALQFLERATRSNPAAVKLTRKLKRA